MDDSRVNIQGLDKVQLLYSLWSNQKKANFFIFNDIPAPSFDHEAAENEIKSYIDYFCGRCIKADLSGDFADSSCYNRDAGEKRFETVVKNLRKQKNCG